MPFENYRESMRNILRELNQLAYPPGVLATGGSRETDSTRVPNPMRVYSPVTALADSYRSPAFAGIRSPAISGGNSGDFH